MNFFNRLTTIGKSIIILIIVGIIGAALYFSGVTKNMSNIKIGSGGYDATVFINTYSGFSPIVYANGGLEGSDNSIFKEKYNLKLKFVIMDDFQNCRSAMVADEGQIGYCTLDALGVEMGDNSNMQSFAYFMNLNFSAGADAIVANGTVNSLNDLKGKKVAFTEGTASHTLLLSALESAGLTMNDITPVVVSNATDAAMSFKSGAVPVCVTWSPDDIDCVKAVKNSKIIASTLDANSLVSDGFIAKKEWLEKNKELAAKITEAFLYANSQMKDEAFAKAAAECFAKNFETDLEFAENGQKKIRYSTLTDNENWFGLNTSYTGMTAEKVYTKMARAYADMGLVKNPLPWRKVGRSDIIESLLENNSLDNNQEAYATAEKQFAAPTEKLQDTKALSSKKVIITFPTAGYSLDNEARGIIDSEFIDIIQSFSNMRVRVVGNTDNTGNYDSNVILSKKRAQSVVDYISKEYKIDKNRFVVVGNGPKKAVAAGVNGASADYRTTDLELITE